ncbi:MAG: mechanosensitive ion channel [Planctomycetota bacterium]|nr:mechanosensitive ion channel [Planctomycetota bacterium]
MARTILPLILALVAFATPASAQEADLAHANRLKTELETLAKEIDKLQGDLDTLQDKLVKAKDAKAKAPIQDLINTKQAERDRKNADRASKVRTLVTEVARLKNAGADVSELNAFLTTFTGDITNLDAGAALSLMQKWYGQSKDWLIEKGPGVLLRILGFLLILLAFKLLASAAGRVTARAIDVSKLDVSALLSNFFVNVVSKVVFFIGLVIALAHIGVNTGPLLAGFGVAGLVIGFALQGTLSNFASGVMILLYRPYDIGHVVTAGGVTGSVQAMTLVSTTIKTPDNQIHIVPNNSIWGGVITNVTSQETRRVDMTIGVGYGDDLDKTAAVLTEIVTGHELVLEDPEPAIELANLGASSIDFIVRPWTKTDHYWRVKFDLNKQIKQRLDREGISIPYPQQDIHIVSNAPA